MLDSQPSYTFRKNKICRLIALLISFLLILECKATEHRGIQHFEVQIPNLNRKVRYSVYYRCASEQPETLLTKGIWKQQGAMLNASILATNQKVPLILILPDLGMDRMAYTWLAESLTIAGYIVAILDHSDQSSYSWSAESLYLETWKRVSDVKSVIDDLVGQSFFAENLDSGRIYTIGIGLGGFTALMITGARVDPVKIKELLTPFARFDVWSKDVRDAAMQQDWSVWAKDFKDQRINAVVLISPTFGNAFTAESLRSISPPCLLITTDDYTQNHSKQINSALLPKQVVKIQHALITDFLNECGDDGKATLPAHICKNPADQRPLIQQRASREIIDFLVKLTSPQYSISKILH